ncbi:MAG: MotA/TolQ/ExbB proton channel family protein [Deltaproteobacteria bacterium]|nr:MotA/TolQ/ExbB proton channel family protein [Deltaproteobacteria bacterium]
MKCIPVKLIILILLALLGPVATVAAASWEEVSRNLELMNEQGRSRAEMISQLLREDENSLKKSLAQYQQQVAREKQELSRRQNELAELKEVESRLRHELAAEEEEIEVIQGVVLGAAKRVNDLFEHSYLGPEMAERRQLVDRVMTKKSFPGMDEIRGLIALCRDYSQESGKTALYRGQYYTGDGSVVAGDIGRIGALAAVYQGPDAAGYLQTSADGKELVAVNGRVPGAARQEISEYLQGKAEFVPLDISGGTVFLQMVQEKTLKEWLKSGGILVWPILAIGLVAILLALERAWFFLRIRSNSGSTLQQLTELVVEGRRADCDSLLARRKSYPTSRVLGNILKHADQSQEILDNVLEEALLSQVPRLERFLPTLAMLAAIAPLLGLLGTVTGMISTFQVINIFGTGDPKMMSGGISEALITTQVGLVVAIPIMLIHHIFERRVDTLIADLEEKGTAFKITVMKNPVVGL